MGFKCKGRCKDFVGYEKGHTCFAVEGKNWCTVCDYKIPNKDRECQCCGCRFRRVARTDRIKQRQNQMELNSHFEVVSVYTKQI